MTNQQKFDRLRRLLDEADVYARAVGKLDFDMQCCAPKDGMEQAGADMAVLSDRHFRLTHTKRYAQLVTELHADSEGLTPVQKKVVEHLYEAWEKQKNIPAKLNYEMSLAYNRAYSFFSSYHDLPAHASRRHCETRMEYVIIQTEYKLKGDFHEIF